MIKKNTYSFYHKRIRTALCAVLCSVLTAMPTFATGEDNNAAAATTATTVWTKASEIMQDVYSQIISISTVTAVVCAAVALLLMNFSKNGKTVDDSRAWLKRIAITWAILNGLGFIMAYVTPFFQGGEPTLAGLDFFRFFTQTVRKYNQKRVTVQYAIQTNGLAITEEWAEFFSKDHFLVGISLDGTPDVHDALRPDAQGNGTWDKITQTIKLLRRCGVECNLLCVVTKRLAKKAERVYKSMKATGVRYLQFIPCLDPLDTPQGQQNYSLTPELYAQFLCAMFDAWYRDWKTSTYISIRLFEDYIHLLMGSPAGTCSTTGTCGAYMVVEGSGAVYPCDFFCLDAYKLGTVQNDTLQSLLTGKKMQTFITDGWQIPAECRQCRWIRLCRGGCKRDRNATDTAQRSYYCKALQKFFAYAEPRLCEMVRAVQMYR